MSNFDFDAWKGELVVGEGFSRKRATATNPTIPQERMSVYVPKHHFNASLSRKLITRNVEYICVPIFKDREHNYSELVSKIFPFVSSGRYKYNNFSGSASLNSCSSLLLRVGCRNESAVTHLGIGRRMYTSPSVRIRFIFLCTLLIKSTLVQYLFPAKHAVLQGCRENTSKGSIKCFSYIVLAIDCLTYHWVRYCWVL